MDFVTDEDFYRYEEEREDISKSCTLTNSALVYNLSHGINYEEIERELTKFKRQNNSSIIQVEQRRKQVNDSLNLIIQLEN